MKLPDKEGLTVAYDTESSGLFADDGARVSAVSCAWRDPATGQLRSFAVPFDQGLTDLPLGPKVLPRTHERRVSKWDPADLAVLNRPPKVWGHLHRWLLRQDLVMHHAKHDCLQAAAGLRDRPDTGYDLMSRVIADTMLTIGVIEPREPVALKTTAVRLHLGQELGIEEGAEADEQEALGPWKGSKEDPRYDLIPWRVLGPYSKLDAELTLLLYEDEQSVLEGRADRTLDKQVSDDLRLCRLLYRMERKGVGLDVAGMRQEAADLWKLVREAGAAVPFKGGTGMPTPPAAVKYFFGAPAAGGLGLLPYDDKLTKTRRPQVDEEVIERLVRRGEPGAREYQTYAELKAAFEKWYQPWPALCGTDGRIRTVHKQGHVVSGRLSVERWQAQAMPHDYQIPEGTRPPRYFLTTPDGLEAWEADAGQAEIRVATAIAREKSMLRALRAGADSHDAACKLMFFPALRISEAKKLPEWVRYRQVAKRCNLGILYGIGAKGLQIQIAKFTGIEYSVAQCAEWITDWKGAFPGFARALYDYADLASGQGYVRLVTGRVRKFSEWEPTHKAFNQCIQGNVAEGAKLAMIRFDTSYPDMLLLQIHDSLVAEIPSEQTGQVVPFMQQCLVATFQQLFPPVPFVADAKPFGRLAYQDVGAAT